ncbi:MAG: FHA domain-containing protein [Propionibacteriaceae bacterium]|nr:FHA domain-containing protein [Propionibacteriaceae bacterium]
MTSRFTSAPATGGIRTAAYLIDLALVVALGAAAHALTRSLGVTAIVVLQLGVAFSVARAASGYTPGGWLTGTVAYATGTAQAPGLQAQIIRSTLTGALHLTLIGPLVTVALTRDGQDWVDRVAGTATAKLSRRQESAPKRGLSPEPGRWDATGFEPWAPPSQVPQPAAPRPSEPPSWASPPPAAAQARSAMVVSPDAPPDARRAATSGPEPRPAPPPEGTRGPIPTIQANPAAGRRAEEPSRLPAMPPSQGPVWVSPDTGTPVELRGVLVLGREPSATEAGQLAVPVPDPTRSLSRTHMRIGSSPSGVWVEDCYSTNGTFCQFPDGRTIELTPGVKHQVPIGSVVLMGDRTCAITQG